jgi:hypothetical protein
MAALSMVMGQIGLWSGTWHLTSPRVDSKTVIEMGPVQVFATASNRAGVPVQWEEGFSLLVMARWDGQLSREILLNWLNTMQVLFISTLHTFRAISALAGFFGLFSRNFLVFAPKTALHEASGRQRHWRKH